MMTRAYNELYLEDTMRNMGVMLAVLVSNAQGQAEKLDQDIRRAEARTVLALARALGCRVEMLCE